MKTSYVLLLTALPLIFIGCATTPKTQFYLVPDPEGKVGEVDVTNQTGTVTLTKANETVATPRNDQPFSETREAAPEEIQAKFAEAFAIMPPPPKGFSIYFDSDSSKLSADSMGAVEQVLAEAKKRDSRDISLNGHTDRAGDAAYNMKLSLGRANTVKELLIKQGISAEYISIEYYGESKPVVPTADNVSEPKNRRVEAVVR